MKHIVCEADREKERERWKENNSGKNINNRYFSVFSLIRRRTKFWDKWQNLMSTVWKHSAQYTHTWLIATGREKKGKKRKQDCQQICVRCTYEKRDELMRKSVLPQKYDETFQHQPVAKWKFIKPKESETERKKKTQNIFSYAFAGMCAYRREWERKTKLSERRGEKGGKIII